MTQSDHQPTAPTHAITIVPSGWQCVGDDTHTLMEAARVAGIALPSSCRNGTCRTCLCLLQSGAIRYRIEWPGVSADEKTAGWILPCVAIATSDVTIVSPGAVKILESAPANPEADTTILPSNLLKFTDK